MTKSKKSKLVQTHASVHLERDSRHGNIVLDAEQVSRGTELSMTIQGQLGKNDFYGKMCTGDRGHLVLMHSRYGAARRSLILSDTDDPQVGQISIVDGSGAPKCFRLDLRRLNGSKSHTLPNLTRCIMDDEAREFNEVIRRHTHGPTVEELRPLFAQDPAYTAFLAANTVPEAEANWAAYCWLIVLPNIGLVMLAFRRCRG